MAVNAQDYLQELQANIRDEDVIKARFLLEHWSELDSATQNEALLLLSQSSPFCTHILGLLYREEASSRIEAIYQELAPQFPWVWADDVKQNPSCQLIAIAKRIAPEVALPTLLTVLHSTLDQELLLAGIQALGELGDPEGIDPLTDLLYSGKRPLIEASIRALEQIKSPLVSQRLSERMGTSRDLDVLILNALAEIQDEAAIATLSKMLLSSDAGLRNQAKTLLEKLGAMALPQLIRNLEVQHNDLLIHTLNILGLIGEKEAAAPIRHLIQEEPEDPNVRFAAYEALGMLPLDKGAFILAEGLSDPVFAVCIAAARAIERHHTPVMLKGILNLIKSKDAASQRIVAAFLDSQADQLVTGLSEDADFREMAKQHLAQEAHPDIRQHFIHILDLQNTQETSTSRYKIYAVDDSRMILNIYKTALYQIGCEPQLFEFPQSAIEQIFAEKPDLVITDLNMPEITGIELAQRVRTRYNKIELPILMVTTQNDLSDHTSAYEAGVNAILHKPFTKEGLKEAIDRLLKISVH